MIAVRGVAPGFDSHNVPTMEMSLNADRYRRLRASPSSRGMGATGLSAVPAVEASAAALWLPIEVGDGLPFQIVGRPANKDCCGGRWMSGSWLPEPLQDSLPEGTRHHRKRYCRRTWSGAHQSGIGKQIPAARRSITAKKLHSIRYLRSHNLETSGPFVELCRRHSPAVKRKILGSVPPSKITIAHLRGLKSVERSFCDTLPGSPLLGDETPS